MFRFSALGDIALAVPVVCTALEQNPGLHIDFVAPAFSHSIFPEHERLRLLGFDKNQQHKGIKGLYHLLKSLDLEQYDAIADLHDVLRTKFLSSLLILNRKKVVVIDKDRKSRNNFIKGKSRKPLKHTTEKYADVFRKLGLKVELDHTLQNFLLTEIHKENIIGVAPFARHEGKRIDLETLKKAVQTLAEEHEILVFGSEEELKSISDWTSTPGITLYKGNGLKEEIRKMCSLQLMITMDSANMHLASIAGVPVISVWGVTHPDVGFLGYGQKRENVIQDETLTWRPTSVYGNKTGSKDNPNGMKNITAEMIVDKVNSVLKRKAHA